jgi:3-hydroxyacyl-[acyl-carrier-protein] dehydratase
MHFTLIDRVLERDETSLAAIKHVSAAEEYLQDHFPGYPVLPGVLMLEAMVQAARELAGERERPLVLGRAGALKYGAMVRPGDSILIRVSSADVSAAEPEFRGEVLVVCPSASPPRDEPRRAASGKFTLRAARTDTDRPASRPAATVA